MWNQVLGAKLYSPCRTLPNILSFALNSSPPDYPMYLALTTSVLQSSTYISCLLYSLLSTSHTPHLLTTLDPAWPCDIALLTTVCCIPRPTSPAFYILWTPPLFLLRSFAPHTSSQDHDRFLQSSTYISYLLHSSLSTSDTLHLHASSLPHTPSLHHDGLP